jgi:hypothetical protein
MARVSSCDADRLRERERVREWRRLCDAEEAVVAARAVDGFDPSSGLLRFRGECERDTSTEAAVAAGVTTTGGTGVPPDDDAAADAAAAAKPTASSRDDCCECGPLREEARGVLEFVRPCCCCWDCSGWFVPLLLLWDDDAGRRAAPSSLPPRNPVVEAVRSDRRGERACDMFLFLLVVLMGLANKPEREAGSVSRLIPPCPSVECTVMLTGNARSSAHEQRTHCTWTIHNAHVLLQASAGA